MSIIKRLNESKRLLDSKKAEDSTTGDFLHESVNSPNVRSILIDKTEINRQIVHNLQINKREKDSLRNTPFVSTPNGHKDFPKEKKNNENLIDFSSDSIEKSSPNFDFNLSSKIKTNVSNSSISVSQSAGKSSKLSDPSKFKKLKYYLLDSSNKFECFISHVVSPFLFFIQYKDVFYRKENFENKIKYFWSIYKFNSFYLKFLIISLFYDDPVNNQNSRVEIFDETLIYAVRYSDDKKWYRAKIISINQISKQ